MEPKQNIFPAAAILIIVLAVGGIFYFGSSKAPAPSASEEDASAEGADVNASETAEADSSQEAQSADTAQAGTYPMTEVAKHDSASSCWTVIDGNVYDLTKWIPKHPGGPGAILGICGKDATKPFRNQHGTAPKQENILATFKIGVLAP
ncbi:MAG: cytochrome b5-like heme/steroid binding domain-containing protein [Patescibacteria group bacterium]